MGLGILGAHRLAERFHIESVPGQGTTVEIGRTVPATRRIDHTDAARVGAALAMQAAQSPFEEIQRQNQELMQALEEVRTRQAQVERLNAELEETNRGVLALYAELDDRAQDLRRASEYKSRFLSDVSHELRTPLTSVLNLSRLLLDRADGDLTPEQERQVGMIRRSVEMVTELVNELLDVAKIEAGKTTLHHSEFTVDAFFASLRALARPLLDGDRVALQFEDETGNAVLHTDEKRLAQILRNFLSNAIKFTEAGSIRVVASWADDGRCVCIAVHDTGIGIARADLDRIFQDFVQLDGPIQRRVRGTGLGLPLTRKLGALLGGGVGVTSVVDEGSVFSVTVPRVHPDLVEPTDAEPGQ
jgi:signal transduction histidine kinase